MQHVVVSFESGVSKEDNQFGVAMSIPGCDSFLAGGASLRETVNHRHEKTWMCWEQVFQVGAVMRVVSLMTVLTFILPPA